MFGIDTLISAGASLGGLGGSDSAPAAAPVSGTYGARYYAPINGNQGTASNGINWMYVLIVAGVLVVIGLIAWAFKSKKKN
ncbi:MAG: hypothetical protein WC661_10250 [Opitutaceae bacterium]|jgi:hypothetical protein